MQSFIEISNCIFKSDLEQKGQMFHYFTIERHVLTFHYYFCFSPWTTIKVLSLETVLSSSSLKK